VEPVPGILTKEGEPAMTATYDLSSTAGKMRLLLGDTDLTAVTLTDEELTGIYQLTSTLNEASEGYEILLLSCAMALDSIAAKAAIISNDIVLGSLTLADRYKVQELRAMAKQFRQAVEEMPAFAISEENLSGFNELTIIRNYVLRTEV
jgi:hypothetical protein